MHKSNFVTAIKVGGKVLREFDNSVYVPFGSEYSILLKNLSSKRAKVSVTIDGTDALDGNTIIVEAKDSVDLKRFLKSNNMNEGNAFKFIEKTAKISNHRGDRAEDGLITITYEFETDYAKLNQPTGPFYSTPYRDEPFWFYQNSHTIQGGLDTQHTYTSNAGTSLASDDVARAQYCGTPTVRSFLPLSTPKNVPKSQAVPPKNDAGITAPGRITEQKFVTATYFWGDGIKHDMTIQLKGGVGPEQKPVKAPVTVTRLKRCSMCGTNVRQVAKFCHECGASVEIL